MSIGRLCGILTKNILTKETYPWLFIRILAGIYLGMRHTLIGAKLPLFEIRRVNKMLKLRYSRTRLVRTPSGMKISTSYPSVLRDTYKFTNLV